MIRGTFRGGRPFARCRVGFPRLGLSADISFLVDTGAGLTCVHPHDADSMGIPYDLLESPGQVLGIGGASQYFREPAYLIFSNESEEPYYGYRVDVRVAAHTATNMAVPSLLGWDLLGRWRVDCDRAAARLQFTVHSADFTVVA